MGVRMSNDRRELVSELGHWAKDDLVPEEAQYEMLNAVTTLNYDLEYQRKLEGRIATALKVFEEGSGVLRGPVAWDMQKALKGES